MKRIAKFALWGAIGFGIGGAIGGATWFEFQLPQFGFAIMGAVGGAFLGLVLSGWQRAGLLALACAIGFGVGFMTVFFIVLTIWEPLHVEGLFLGGVGGACGGASLGLATRNWRKAGILALAGAIGFGVAMQARLDSYILEGGFLPAEIPYMFTGTIFLSVLGILGGAFLGATLGFLEREKTN